MPIGDVVLPDKTVAKAELRARYDDLIKEAIKRAVPDSDIVRADDVAAPGGITTDIFTRLMHSDYVVADITYPNPNVFYELGIRHACRPGTVLVRERIGSAAPFDVAGLRHVEYENTPTGLKLLSNELKQRFEWIDVHPKEPDNDFLSLAKLTGYQFQDAEEKSERDRKVATFAVVSEIAKHPEILQLMIESSQGGGVDQAELLRRLGEKPEALKALLFFLVHTGQLKI